MQKEELVMPTGIQVSNSEQVLEITWSDIGTVTFPLFGLRKNCPCVICRGGHGNMENFEPEAFKLATPPYIEITDIKPVGNHAIQIFWGDSHNSGMYRWETLKMFASYL